MQSHIIVHFYRTNTDSTSQHIHVSVSLESQSICIMMMAEADMPSLSSLSLMCPVCLDTFKDPTILIGCGHTYCRGCLKNLIGNAGRNAIMCPECRGITKLDRHGVRTLPPNVTIKKLLSDSKDLATRGLHCSFHEFAKRDIYCEDCEILLCPLCFSDGHTTHRKKTRHDFQRDVQELVELCRDRRAVIENRKMVIEQHRVEVTASMQRLRNNIEKTFEKKLRLLHQSREALAQEVSSREECYHKDLDGMLARYTQIVDDMEGALALINKESIADLGEDSLMIHTQQCLVGKKLIEIPYKDTAGKLKDTARSIQFQEGGKQLLSWANF